MTAFCEALKKAVDEAPEGALDPLKLLFDQHCYGFKPEGEGSTTKENDDAR